MTLAPDPVCKLRVQAAFSPKCPVPVSLYNPSEPSIQHGQAQRESKVPFVLWHKNFRLQLHTSQITPLLGPFPLALCSIQLKLQLLQLAVALRELLRKLHARSDALVERPLRAPEPLAQLPDVGFSGLQLLLRSTQQPGIDVSGRLGLHTNKAKQGRWRSEARSSEWCGAPRGQWLGLGAWESATAPSDRTAIHSCF